MKHSFCWTILLWSIASTPAYSQSNWRFHEETMISGTVAGVVKQGHIFKTTSGSIYELAEPYIDVVVEVMPKAIVLTNGVLYKLIVDGFREPLICKKLTGSDSVHAPGIGVQTQRALALLGYGSSTADSATASHVGSAIRLFQVDRGFPATGQLDSRTLLALADSLGKHPPATSERIELAIILLGSVSLTMDEPIVLERTNALTASAARDIPELIESRIDGNFEGYDYGNIYKLANGQIWEQTSVRYRYRYRHRPKVMVIKRGNVHEMRVEPLEDWITVRRLK